MHQSFTRIIIVGSAVLLGAVVQILRGSVRSRKIRKLMSGRVKRSDTEFGELFPPAQSESAIKLRRMLSKYCHADLDGLEPGDWFREELYMREIDGSSMLKFMTIVEEEFNVSLPSSAKCMRMKFTDFVKAVASTR